MSQDLKLCSDDDLMEELRLRYQSTVIGLWRPHSKEVGLGVFKLRWSGDSFISAGLCNAIQDEINTARRNDEEPHDQDS